MVKISTFCILAATTLAMLEISIVTAHFVLAADTFAQLGIPLANQHF